MLDVPGPWGGAPGGQVVLAHAVAVRSDLPVPLLAVLLGGGLAVVASFVGLGALWHRSKLRGDEAGRPLPGAVQAVVDSPVLRWALRLVVLALTLLVVVVALVGPRETTFSLAPYAFYVTFWVGIVPASLLLGPVWREVNPLRTLHAPLARLAGPPPGADALPRVGLWPATAALLAYAWLELVYPDRALPQTVGFVLVGYALVQLVASLWYGEQWFAAGDAFEVYSTLVGRLALVGRRADGRLVLRNPLDGVDGVPQVPGLAAFVTALVGTTAFDGVTRTDRWLNRFSSGGVTAYTVGLLLTVALVAGLYAAATRVAGRVAGVEHAPRVFAHSVVPIAVGYAIAHYFSLLVFEGQYTWILASNPFAQDGVDLFGTYRHELDLRVVSAETIASVQVAAIVLGHVIGVVLAHDRAVRLSGSSAAARRSQYPLLAVMVAFTVGGLSLLLG